MAGPASQLAGVSCSVDEPFLSTGTFSRSRNRRGNHVQSLQWYLEQWGYLSGVDGIYGPNTEAAVAAFQEEAGLLLVDGIVGPDTQGALCDAVVNWTNTGDPFTGGGDTGGGNGGGDGPGDGGGIVPGTSPATDKWVYVAGAGIGVGAALLYARS
jgi:peptidoglycan hydrolase-like protein with peptidoglycan-binding domain